MSLFRSPHSQDGNDVPHRNSSNNRLLLSMVGSDGQVQYAAIAIPESYAAAHRKAIVTFRTQLGNAAATPHTIVLKYGMRSVLGYVVWAAIDAASWVDVVQDGGEVRVEVTGGVQATQLSQAQWTESFLPGATLTFRYKSGASGSATLATTLVPKTYEDAKKVAIELFNIHQSDANQISLELWIPEGPGPGFCMSPRIIHPAQWQPVILRTARENPRFEVSVKNPRTQYSYHDRD